MRNRVRKNVILVLVSVLFCLSLVLCLLPLHAFAGETTIAVNSLFSAQSATVTAQSGSGYAATPNLKGAKIEKNATNDYDAYSVAVNGTFSAETENTIELSLLIDNLSEFNDTESFDIFSIRVADEKNPEKYFDLEVASLDVHYLACGVVYDGTIYTTNRNGQSIHTYDASPKGDFPYVTGALTWPPLASSTAATDGQYYKVTFKVVNGKFGVYTNYTQGGKFYENYRIAEFDGAGSRYGLPLISEILSSGKYTVTFLSGQGTGSAHLTAPALIRSIGGTVFGEADEVTTPAWYNPDAAFVKYVYADNVDAGNVKTNPNPVAFTEGSLTLKPLTLIHDDVFNGWKDKDGNAVTSLTYEKGKQYELYADITVKGKQPIEGLFSTTYGSVKAAQGTGYEETPNNNGVLLATDESGKSLATFERLYDVTEENNIDFMLTNSVGRANTITDLFNFRFVDALDDTKFFDVRIVSTGYYYAGAFVVATKNGEEYAVSTSMRRGRNEYSGFIQGFQNSENPDGSAYCWSVSPYNNSGYNGRYFSISLKTNGNALEVYANFIAGGSWNTRLIASFDGTKNFADNVSFGLPYIREFIPSGKYKIELSSGIDRNENGHIQKPCKILVNKIGNVVFGLRTEDYEPDWNKDYADFYAIGKDFIRVAENQFVNKYYDSEQYIIVPQAKLVSGGESKNVFKIQLVQGEKAKDVTAYSGGYLEPLAAGEYALRFVGDESESVVYEIPFTVFDRRKVDKTVTVFDQIYTTQTVGKGIYIPEATFVYDDYPDYKPMAVERVFVKRTDGKVWTDVTEFVGKTYFGLAEGSYALKYVAVNGGVDEGNEVWYYFNAYENSFDVADLFETSGNAAYTYEYASGDEGQHQGVLIDNGGKVGSSKIKGVFSGNSQFTFSFPKRANGSYYLRFQSATDANDYFLLAFYNGNAFVIDKFAAAYNVQASGTVSKYENPYTWVSRNPALNYGANGFTSDFNACTFGGVNEESVTAKVEFDGDVVTLKVKGKSSERVLARFDGTNSVNNDTTPKQFGMEKVDFKNGYTVSFENADLNSAVTVLVEDVDGVSTGCRYINETYRLEKSWQTNYNTGVAVVVDGFSKTVYDNKLTVPNANYYHFGNPTANTDFYKIELVNAAGKRTLVHVGDELKLPVSGNYTLAYTATSNEATFGNVKEVPFVVQSGGFDRQNIFNVDEGKTVTGYVAGGKYNHSGVLIAQDESGNVNGGFNGVFKGNTSVTFTFPEGESFRTKSFRFRVSDVDDSSEYFDLLIYEGTNGVPCVAVQDKKGVYRSMYNNSAVDYGIIAKAASPSSGIPSFGGVNWGGATLALIWEGDVLSVIVKGSDTRVFGTMVLAKFDGTDVCSRSVRDNDGNPTYGLDKLSFKDGYQISFVGKNTDVVFEEVGTYTEFVKNHDVIVDGKITTYQNGTGYLADGGEGAKLYTDFDFVVSDEDLFTLTSYGNIEAETVVVNATKDKLSFADIKAGAYYEYTVKLAESFTVVCRDELYPDEEYIDALEEKELHYTFQKFSMTISQTVKVEKGNPYIAFKDGKSELVFAKNDANKLYLKASDVDAIDYLDGALSEVKIYVKAPNAVDFTLLQGEEYIPEEYGTYLVRYEATNSNGKTGFAERTIEVVDGRTPIISVGDVPKTVYVKDYIDIPAATAKVGETEVPVACSVYRDGVKLAIENGKVFVDKAGTYTLGFYAENEENGKEACLFLEIVAVYDEEAPIMGEIELVSEAKVGDTITLPNPQIFDNADENVQVKITVNYYGVTKTVENGSFVADKEGTYIVIYTATDRSGNTVEKIFTLNVKK